MIKQHMGLQVCFADNAEVVLGGAVCWHCVHHAAAALHHDQWPWKLSCHCGHGQASLIITIPRPRARQSVQCFPTLQTPECMSVITLMAAVSEALISTNDKGNCHFNEATIFFTLWNNLMVQLPLS